jgi:hypothetical protein
VLRVFKPELIVFQVGFCNAVATEVLPRDFQYVLALHGNERQKAMYPTLDGFYGAFDELRKKKISDANASGGQQGGRLCRPCHNAFRQAKTEYDAAAGALPAAGALDGLLVAAGLAVAPVPEGDPMDEDDAAERLMEDAAAGAGGGAGRGAPRQRAAKSALTLPATRALDHGALNMQAIGFDARDLRVMHGMLRLKRNFAIFSSPSKPLASIPPFTDLTGRQLDFDEAAYRDISGHWRAMPHAVSVFGLPSATLTQEQAAAARSVAQMAVS